MYVSIDFVVSCDTKLMHHACLYYLLAFCLEPQIPAIYVSLLFATEFYKTLTSTLLLELHVHVATF